MYYNNYECVNKLNVLFLVKNCVGCYSFGHFELPLKQKKLLVLQTFGNFLNEYGLSVQFNFLSEHLVSRTLHSNNIPARFEPYENYDE